jgi:hypothetical protein
MKKTILTLALLITSSNLALGIVYAATCTSPGGSRLCGATCSKASDGSCICQGSCTKAEMDWVAGGGQAAEIEESPVN